MADEHGDYFSNAIDSAKVTNLVEKDFEKHPSVESIRQAYQGLQYGFNEIGSGEVENELKMIKSNKATRWDVNCQGLLPSLTSLCNTGKPTASQSSEIPDPYYRSTSFQENPCI